jgi:hypothetical protein
MIINSIVKEFRSLDIRKVKTFLVVIPLGDTMLETPKHEIPERIKCLNVINLTLKQGLMIIK